MARARAKISQKKALEHPTCIRGYKFSRPPTGEERVITAECKTSHKMVSLWRLLEPEAPAEPIQASVRNVAELISHRALLPILARFTNHGATWVVTPVTSGSLRSRAVCNSPLGLDEVTIATAMAPVLAALTRLHTHQQAHTQLTAASIMLTRDGQSLLLPPSLAADLCSLDAPATETVGDIEQTDQHSAPAPCDKAAAAQAPGLDLRAKQSQDIWALGWVLFELSTGHLPPIDWRLRGPSLQSSSEDDALESLPKRLSEVFKHLLSKCFARPVSKQPPAATLLDHPFWKLAKDASHTRQRLQLDLLDPLPDTCPAKKLPQQCKTQMSRQAQPGLPLPTSANGSRTSIMDYAVQLLLRLAQDSKQKALMPFLPWEELQACKGVCFGVIKRKMSSTRGSVGRGHGFVMLKQLEVKQATKVQHARTSSIYQMPKCWWTAPAWVNFDIGNLTPDFVHNVVDFMLPIPDDATAACFTQLPGRLGLQQSTGPAAKGTSSWRKLVAYARTSNIRFEWPLTGCHVMENPDSTNTFYGQGMRPDAILSGDIPPPPECSMLQRALTAMACPMSTFGIVDTLPELDDTSRSMSLLSHMMLTA